MYVHLDQIVELVMMIAHRSRIAFEQTCSFEEYVPHEILLLRALVGTRVKGRDLAKTIGWSAGRVSQVAGELVKKGMLESDVRTKRLTKTVRGAHEAESGGCLLGAIGERLLTGFTYDERDELEQKLRRIATNSERLWRVTRDPTRDVREGRSPSSSS